MCPREAFPRIRGTARGSLRLTEDVLKLNKEVDVEAQ
jgi:hypothetical protein